MFSSAKIKDVYSSDICVSEESSEDNEEGSGR